MSTTGRILRWIVPGLLCCGGCAAPLWQVWPASHGEQVESATSGIPASSEASSSLASAQDEAAEPAAAEETARELGLREPEAARLAEIFLGAYAEMYRQAAQTARTDLRSAAGRDAAAVPEGPTAAHGNEARAEPTAGGHVRTAASTPADASPQTAAGTSPRGLHRPGETAAGESGRADSRATPQATARVDRARRDAPSTQLAQFEQEPDAPGDDTSSAVSTSGMASTDDPQGSWTRHVRLAIERLRDELAREDLDARQRAQGQVCLSLLSLAAEDPEQALEGLQDLDDQQLEFWRQTVMGMGVLLDPDELPKLRHRVALATQHLEDGLAALSALGPLQLRNVTLCTKVDGFGDFVECSGYGLEPGKPVLLYVEVENFTSEVVPATAADDTWSRSAARRDGRGAGDPPRYATELHARYEILDAQQRTVVSRALPVGGDVCRNRRRDYYISYVLYLPEQITPGAYTLELTVEDKKGGKFGNAVVGFQINPR